MADRRDQGQQNKVPSSSILRMAIENTGSAQNNEESSQFQEMDSERREWLKNAISDIVKEDDVVKMRKCLDILQKYEGDSEESVQIMSEALEVLLETVETIDNAMDLHKIGGLKVMGELLENSSSEVRWRAAEVIAVCTQNNPFCQDAVLTELRLLPTLCELLDTDQVESVKVKALYAISGLIRQHEQARQEFVSREGLSILMRAMQVDNSRLRVKAAFLLKYIITKDPKSCDDACSMGMVDQLVAMLHGPIAQYHEHILDALVHLTSNEKAVKDCRRTELNLQPFLTERISSLKKTDPEQYKEQIDYCRNLLQLCFQADNCEMMNR